MTRKNNNNEDVVFDPYLTVVMPGLLRKRLKCPHTFVITGTPRGGTSALAYAVGAEGIDLNDKGKRNLEDRAFVSVITRAEFNRDGLRKLVAERNRKDVWGFKLPAASFHLDEIDREIRNGIYLCVFRNINDTARSSINRKTEPKTLSMLSAALSYKKEYDAITSSMERGDKPFILVSYETLLYRTAEVVENLYRVLGISPRFLRQTVKALSSRGYKPLNGSISAPSENPSPPPDYRAPANENAPVPRDGFRTDRGVSVIIPVLDNPGRLERMLASFFHVNTYQPVEVLVLDQGSFEDMPAAAGRHAGEGVIRFMDLGRKHSSAEAFLFGASRAKYPYLLFLKNQVFASDILHSAVAELERKPEKETFKTGPFEITRNPRKVKKTPRPEVRTGRSGTRGEWDTRSCPSVTSEEPRISLPRRLYIVPRKMKPGNTTRYRAHHLAELCRGLTEVELVDYTRLDPGFFDRLRAEKDAAVLQRFALKDRAAADFLERLRASRVRIIYDIDDQIFDPAELEQWRFPEIANRPEDYFECMKHADQFLVSTKKLRRKVEEMFQKPVHVLPNLLCSEQAGLSRQAASEKEKHADEFIIGYAAGSSTHDRDLDQALEGVGRFMSQVPEARFHCIGYAHLPGDFTAAYRGRITVEPKVDWRDLPKKLARFSVQIIPLEDCPFNRYKSQVRFLESAAVGVPVLASSVGEQAQTIIHKQTGFLCSSSGGGWYQGLRWYHENPGKRHAVGLAARNTALGYWTTGSVFRIDKMKNILQDFTLGVMRDKVSVIVVAYNPFPDVKALCESIIAHTNVPYELLVWINSPDPFTREYLHTLEPKTTYIVDLGVNVGKAPAANHLFRLALERFVAGLDDDFVLPEDWAGKMIRAAKAVPDLGWLSANLTPDSSGMRGRGKLCAYPGGVEIYRPSGVGGWMVFTTASAREKIGYYREHGLYGGIDGEYNRRAKKMGLSTGYVRDVVGKHKVGREGFLGWELFKQRIQDEMRLHGKDSDRVGDKFVDFFRDRPENLTCSIRTDAFIPGDANDCDTEAFPEDVKGELEKMDYLVRIDPAGESRPGKIKDDVVLHFYKGRRDRPDPYNLNLLWLDGSGCSLDRQFLIGFDYILCGSGDVFDVTRKLAPEIRAELVEFMTGRDVAEAVHRAVVFLVKNYVDYKSEGLYRLRNGS